MRDSHSGKADRHWAGVIFAHLHLDVVSRTDTVTGATDRIRHGVALY